ncbi:MAG TPA: hypothetical protein VF524_01785, partial [Polyangia bacterium]
MILLQSLNQRRRIVAVDEKSAKTMFTPNLNFHRIQPGVSGREVKLLSPAYLHEECQAVELAGKP